MGKRKDINRFDLAIIRIMELLRHLDRGDIAGNGRLDIGVLKGQGDFLSLARQLTQHRATFRRRLLWLGSMLCAASNHPQLFVGGR